MNIAFDPNIEISGSAPDIKFDAIYRNNQEWEVTITGIKDIDTGEEETITIRIPSFIMAMSMALYIDFRGKEGSEIELLRNIIRDAVKFFWKDYPDHLQLVPPFDT